MTRTPLHIQALRGAAIVLALGAGSWLIVNAQRSARPTVEPPRSVLPPGESDPLLGHGGSEPQTGNQIPSAPSAGSDVGSDVGPSLWPDPAPTFLHSSKSAMLPTARPALVPADLGAVVEGVEHSDRTFLYSSKSLAIEGPLFMKPFVMPNAADAADAAADDPETPNPVAPPNQ